MATDGLVKPFYYPARFKFASNFRLVPPLRNGQ